VNDNEALIAPVMLTIFMQSSAEDLSRNAITPVNSLNPYQNRWTIKVRVTFKGAIKRYTNDRTPDGGGKLFHFDVVDREVKIHNPSSPLF
jgi:hypothetical protein